MSDWIDVNDRLPSTSRTVLIKQEYGNNKAEFIVIGHYAYKYSIEAGADEDCEFLDYEESKDIYFYPQGWYEQQLNWDEYASIYINEKVISWREIDSINEWGPSDE